MKIIQIIPQLSSGGGERFTVDLSNELSAREHEVILCVLHPLRKNETAFYMSDVSKNVRVVSMNKRKGLDIALFWQLYKFIKKERPSLIHTHLRAIVYATLAARFVVHGIHTVHSEANVEASDWFSCIIRKWLFHNKYMQPVTISKQSQDSFKSFYGFDAPLVYNGRNISESLVVSDNVRNECVTYRQNVDTRMIVHLAHIGGTKRQKLMARIAMRLYNEGYNFSVLFIGSDRQVEYVNELRATMPPCCHIIGQRSNPLEYLKVAGAFALCSEYEGFPISLIEALGVGAVPICTPVGGIVNVITDGKNGLLSDDISEESYYKTMKRFLDMNNDEILQMRKRARESYAPFSMTRCAEEYEKIYNEFMKRN